MKVCGIICEFNPFHNGHAQLLAYAKANFDAVVCVMSGNFVQRGEAAVLNKYARAAHATYSGADLVLELPAVYAISAAESFARGAVKILSAYGADELLFGSECGNVELLAECAARIDDAGAEIKRELAAGKSYPAAACAAVKCSGTDGAVLGALLEKSNNALAIEYLRALKIQNSTMRPVTIKREDNFTAKKLDADARFASATAIRTEIEQAAGCGCTSAALGKFVSPDVLSSLSANNFSAGRIKARYERFLHRLLQLADAETLEQTEGVGEGLENRILRARLMPDFEQMMKKIKTRRFTYARLMRILTAYALGITKDIAQSAKRTPAACKVLAVRAGRETELMKSSNNLQLIKSAADYKRLSADERQLFDIDVKASGLYASLTGNTGGIDFTLPLQKI